MWNIENVYVENIDVQNIHSAKNLNKVNCEDHKLQVQTSIHHVHDIQHYAANLVIKIDIDE